MLGLGLGLVLRFGQDGLAGPHLHDAQEVGEDGEFDLRDGHLVVVIFEGLTNPSDIRALAGAFPQIFWK